MSIRALGRMHALDVEHALLLKHAQQQQQHSDAADGFNLLLLVPILAGALLALALLLWLLLRWWRERKRRDTGAKRSDSALLPIVDPTELLSPASRQSIQLQPRGATLSFVAPSPASPAVEQRLDRTNSSGSADRITAAESTALFRALHRDPNVSDHRIAYHKLAFERLLSTRTRRSSSLATRASQSDLQTPHRAFETWLGQYDGEAIVAKVLASHASRAADLQQLVHEIQVTASLEHPNVVRFLGIAWDSPVIESLCMITEYVQDGDLQRVLRLTAGDRNRMTHWSSRMLGVVTDVARALQYLHARRVVHGGVRAKNIVVSRHDWTPKLVNISASRPFDVKPTARDCAAPLPSHWLSTAPEVRSGSAETSERSDIYAFGALLLEVDSTGLQLHEGGDATDGDDSDSDSQAWQKDFALQLRTLTGTQLARAFSLACPPRIVEIARVCLREAPDERMDASTLVLLLEGVVVASVQDELVWLCTYEESVVAVKRLLQTRKRTSDDVHAFIDEIQLTASLAHPHILEVLGVAWNTLENLCMVMEYLPNGDLQGYLRARGSELTWRAHKRALATGVARALAYLHARSPRLIHRDVKARNVLLTAALEAKVIDFGVSRSYGDCCMTVGVGTPYWTAPEVLEGTVYSEKSDIYSFGVLLSELDTCAAPYHDAKAADEREPLQPFHILKLVMAGTLQPTFTAACPVAVQRIAHACLRRDPSERPSAVDVVALLEALGSDGRGTETSEGVVGDERVRM